MMKRLLLTMSLLLALVPVVAQQKSTHRMLVNGRTWNYMSVYFISPVPDTVYHSVTIEGPVEFDGKQCYRIGKDTNKYFYEEGDKVYTYKLVYESPIDPGKLGWKEEFNFGIEPGYKVTYSDDEITIIIKECKSVDAIIVNGVERRRLDFGDDIWVEGIGSSKSGIYADWGVSIGTFMGSKLLSVYDGEECIFTAADFTTKGTVGIKSSVTASRMNSSVYYDLQGRRLAQPPTKGLYIRDGQKVMIKRLSE